MKKKKKKRRLEILSHALMKVGVVELVSEIYSMETPTKIGEYNVTCAYESRPGVRKDDLISGRRKHIAWKSHTCVST